VTDTGPESTVPPASPDEGGAGLRPAGAGVGAGRERIPPHHDPSCWGCGSSPIGLAALGFVPKIGADRRSLAGAVSFDERHQAGPGIVHGGLVSAVLDEATGLLATHYRFPSVTARLFVRFRRPVPINAELSVRAFVESERGRRTSVSGELRGPEDDVLADAKSVYVNVPLEHFLATPEGRAAGEEWRRRLDVSDA
jgi:acyl-coenzyme A thioesterase PaaI-like protein